MSGSDTMHGKPADNPPLPESVRDHLGHELRGVYTETAPEPRYLGDEPTVPEKFEPQIRRLETRLMTHEEGTEAVEQALDRILDAFGVTSSEGETKR